MNSEKLQNQSEPVVNIDIEPYQERFKDSQEEWRPLIQNYLPDYEEYFLSPENFQVVQNLLLEYYPENSQDRLLDWEIEDMKQILGKIMIPDSVRPTYDNAVELAQRLEVNEKSHIDVLELCTGAGLSTMMAWNEIKKAHPDKSCKLVTVDVALESTIMAEIVLRFKDIPIVRVDGIEQVPNNFDGVVLIRKEASETVEEYAQRGNKFDAVFSDHGIGYFEKDIHEPTVKNISESLLKEKGVFALCSLENEVKISLGYLKMVRQILFNKNLLQEIPQKEDPYELEQKGEKILVKAINSKDSAGLYQILQVLFYDGRISDFMSYIKSIAKVAKATKTLSKQVKSPIDFSQSILRDSEVKPSYDEQRYSIARTLWYKK